MVPNGCRCLNTWSAVVGHCLGGSGTDRMYTLAEGGTTQGQALKVDSHSTSCLQLKRFLSSLLQLTAAVCSP